MEGFLILFCLSRLKNVNETLSLPELLKYFSIR